MKISRISKQKRATSRYNIFLDDGNEESYGFSVDEDLLVEYHLHKGMTIEQSLIQTLKQQDTIHQSYRQAINYLGYRMRSKYEIKQYLSRKDVDPEHIDEIIVKLSDKGLIDDKEFADMFVRHRIQQSTKGPQLVKKELIVTKGISNEIASEAIEQYTYDVQYSRAMNVAKKRMRRKSKHSFQRQIQQLQAALTRNGFAHSVIQDVVEECRSSFNDIDEEWEALSKHGKRLLRRYEGQLSGFTLQNKLREALYRQGFSMDNINKFLDENSVE